MTFVFYFDWLIIRGFYVNLQSDNCIITNVMKQTGHDLPSLYKETSEGGLAAMNV